MFIMQGDASVSLTKSLESLKYLLLLIPQVFVKFTLDLRLVWVRVDLFLRVVK